MFFLHYFKFYCKFQIKNIFSRNLPTENTSFNLGMQSKTKNLYINIDCFSIY